MNTLLGDARKARKQLKWKPKIDINKLVDDMVDERQAELKKYAE